MNRPGKTTGVIISLALTAAMVAMLPTASAAGGATDPPVPGDTVTALEDVPAGFDLLETDPAQTQFKFDADTAIPADFFQPGSSPFNGYVKFCGEPMNVFNGQDVGDADTIIKRLSDMSLPGPDSNATVPIEIVSLNLVSCQPITVQVGSEIEKWDVEFDISPTQPSQGTMNVQQTNERGGVFDGRLPVLPLFTFTGPEGNQRVWDFGQAWHLSQDLTATATGAEWNRRCELPALAVPGLNEFFCPGLTPDGKKLPVIWKAPLFQITWYPAQPRLEHFACYRAVERGRKFTPRGVAVTDQFGARKYRLKRPRELCNPAQKNAEPWLQKQVHLKCYAVRPTRVPGLSVVTKDQFGSLNLKVNKPRDVCMPTLKKRLSHLRKPRISGQPSPTLVDRFMCYDVTQQGGREPNHVTVKDQFGKMQLTVTDAVILCNPAQVNRTPSSHPVRHLVCYRVVGSRPRARLVETSNEFGTEVLRVKKPRTLCVPANKVIAPHSD